MIGEWPVVHASATALDSERTAVMSCLAWVRSLAAAAAAAGDSKHPRSRDCDRVCWACGVFIF